MAGAQPTRVTTIAALADALGRPRPTIEGAVRRLTAAGKLEVSRRGRQYIVRPPLEDDGWQPPAQYVGGTRAAILGTLRNATPCRTMGAP